MRGAAIRVQGLTLGYGGRPAVEGLDGTIRAGSLTAVVGPNGGGKSTFLKGMAGIMRPVGGRIEYDYDASVAYLPQAAVIDRAFPISVFEFVAMGLWKSIGALRRLSSYDRDLISQALVAVALTDFGRRRIGELSGGQMQRCLFARLLLQDANVILLDEPFNAIDTKTIGDLAEIVSKWHSEGRTIVAVLHDLQMVRTTFPEALLLARRQIAWGKTVDVVTPDNIIAAHGAA